MKFIINVISVLIIANTDVAIGKVMSGTAQLDGEVPELYLSKFSINGGGSVEGELLTANGEDFETGGIALFIFDAEDWPRYHELVTCMDRARLARAIFSIAEKGEVTADQALRHTYRLQRFKGQYQFKRILDPKEDGEVLYVVLADCSLEQVYHKIPPISYSITFMNNGSHIPADMYSLRTAYILLVLVLIGAGIYGSYLARYQFNRLGTLPLITKLLGVAYWLNLLSSLFQAIHLQVYTQSGQGLWVLEMMSDLLQASFICVVNFVLLALACGWTLTDEEGGMSFMVTLRNPSNLFKWVDIGSLQLPAVIGLPSAFAVILFIFCFIIVEFYDVMTTSREDDHGKSHDHDSPAGHLLMMMEVAFCGLFIFTTYSTRLIVNSRQKHFLLWLMIPGAVWFLVTPALVLCSTMLARVTRHRVITVGTITLQSTALVLMCRLFLTRSSEYYKLSSMANMGRIVGLTSSAKPRLSKAVD